MQQPIGHEDPRSVADLIKELRDESRTLFRQELRLAKTEFGMKAQAMKAAGTKAGVGAGAAFFGVFFLLFAATAGIYGILTAIGAGNMWAGFLAPLIVGGILAAVSYPALRSAKEQFDRESLIPQETVQSVKEDKEWLKKKIA